MRLPPFCAAALVAAGPAAGEPALLVPPDPWEVIHLARAHGPAEVGHDAMDEPIIRAEADGIVYQIAFYGCRFGEDCDTVLFQMRLAREDWAPEPDDIGDWNAAKLFGRAWIDGGETAVLDHALAMPGGLPADALEASFEAWLRAAGEFREHLDF